MDYSNLKSKTIYDFCDDSVILDELVVFSKKEDFFAAIEKKPIINAFILSEYAELTGNETLLKEVNKQYKEEFDSFFIE